MGKGQKPFLQVETLEKLQAFVKKNKWILTVALVGVILLLFPDKKTETATPIPVQPQVSEDVVAVFEEQLEQLLAKVKGVGKVRVMLSLKSGAETVYVTDRNTSVRRGETDYQQTEESKTVLMGGTEPIVGSIRSPVFLGAVVVCEGGERSSTALAVMEAVAALTGLESNAIRVLPYQ